MFFFIVVVVVVVFVVLLIVLTKNVQIDNVIFEWTRCIVSLRWSKATKLD